MPRATIFGQHVGTPARSSTSEERQKKLMLEAPAKKKTSPFAMKLIVS